MKAVNKIALELFQFRAAHSSASARRLEGEMCKELKTKVLRLCPPTSNGPSGHQEGQRDDADILRCTMKALKEGGVVAVPTDTIYGLACLAQSSEGIRKTYEIKGRNREKPLAVCVGEIRDIYEFCKVPVPNELLSDLLPGPVTLVLERSAALNADLNPFTSLVGVRIPDHAFIRRLSQMCGEPLALTSANVSSQTSTVAVHEFQDLWPKLAVVVDGGPMEHRDRLGSTVVDLSVPGKYRIIRPGCAVSSTVDVLTRKYGLSDDLGEH
ncbi:threonylcarbamoyl-AMP synthase [Brachionichthys hirsutus]|uniref:threonylcarbamoyl-AMP synthase n=1 Tax=Brachionichthys hirsutus TaxID=412623 RepID=UPI00360503D3